MTPNPRQQAPRRSKLRFEPLEERTLPANWGGTIPNGTVFVNTEVHRITGNITVAPGSTLTIQPGAIIKVNSAQEINIQGTLLALGTAAQPITFTSYRDDSIGGDTNADGASVGQRGDWRWLHFSNTSTASVLDHVDVRFAGAFFGGVEYSKAAVYVAGGELTLSNSMVQHSAQHGLGIASGTPTVTNTVFVGNGLVNAQAAIGMNLPAQPTLTNLSFTNNAFNGLDLLGTTLAGTTAWNNPDVVYRFKQTITVPVGATLNIEAGQIIKTQRSGVAERLVVNGTLNAQGTGAQPIVFTSGSDDTVGGDSNNDGTATTPQSADWGQIEFTATSTNNLLDFTDIRYGGSSAMVLVNSAPLTLTNSTLRTAQTTAINIVNASPIVRNSTFLDSTNATAITMDAASNPSFSGNTFTNNKLNGILLKEGTITADRTWDYEGTLVLEDSTTIAVGTTVTVAPGQVVKGATFAELVVNGTLDARGTVAEPITFTSIDDDTLGGDTSNDGPNGVTGQKWLGVMFNNTSTANVFEHVNVRHASARGITDQAGAIVLNNAPLTFTNGTITNSSRGLRLNQANPTVTGVTFQQNSTAAIEADVTSNPQLQALSFVENQVNAFVIEAGTLVGDVTWANTDVVYWLAGEVIVPASTTLTLSPGLIIKSPSTIRSTDEALLIDGTLLAQGSASQPILFTNRSDDSAGGDSDFGGGADFGWRGLHFRPGSIGVLDHIEMRGGSGQATNGNGFFLADGASTHVTVRNSVLRDIPYGGFHAKNGATIVGSNILAYGKDTGDDLVEVISGSTITLANATIHGSYDAVKAASGTINLVNSIVTGFRNRGLYDTGGTINVSHTNVFADVHPSALLYSGMPNQTGLNGNLAVDPGYFNSTTKQFNLRATSPMLDSGTATGAPPTDFYGNPFYDDAHAPNNGGAFIDRGAFERQGVSFSDVDLVASDVTGPTSVSPDQLGSVSWTVTNHGTGTAIGPWHDAVYLSADAVWTPDDVLLGTFERLDALGTGQSYSLTRSVPFPSVLPGAYHVIVRTNALTEVYEGQAYLNNASSSANTTAMDLRPLDLGTPLADTIAAAGQDRYYRVTVAAGQGLVLNLDGAANATNELYIRYGSMPTRQAFDERATLASLADQQLSVADTRAGTYYVLVHSVTQTSVQPITITATLGGFGITAVTPARGSNTGQVTLTLDGALFEAGSHVELLDASGAVRQPVRTYFVNSGRLAATFDLQGVPLGLADVRVVKPGNISTTRADTFEVITGQPGTLKADVIVQAFSRTNRTFPVYLEYENTGDTDILAPVVRLEADTMLLSFEPDLSNASKALELVLVAPGSPAGVLAPGTKGRLTLYNHLPVGASAFAEHPIRLVVAEYPNTPIDWDGLAEVIRSEDYNDAEWAELLAALQADFGPTWATYPQEIADAATLFPASIGRPYSLADVFDIKIADAQALAHVSVAGQLFLGNLGRPLGDVPMDLLDPLTGNAAVGLARQDGTFLFPEVEPGVYNVRIRGYVSTTPLQITVGTNDITGQQWIVTRAAQLTGGVLQNDNGMPITGATVTLFAPTGEVYATATDPTGHYVLESLPTGTYTVRVTSATHPPLTVEGLTISELDSVTHRQWLLAPGFSVSGQVTTGAGTGVADVLITATDANGNGRSATTDANGNYTLQGLAEGSYDLTAEGTNTHSTKLQPTLTGNLGNQNFTLVSGATVEGRLVNANAQPIPWAFVTLSQGGQSVAAGQSNAQGDFRIEGLAPGTYDYTTTAQGHLAQQGTFTVTTTNTLDLTVAKAGTITGVVTSSLGAVGGAAINVWQGNELVATTTAQADGSYFVDDLPLGTYDVAWSVGMGSAAVQQASVTLTGSTPQQPANFNRTLAGQIRGTVYTEDGSTPAADVGVHLIDAEGDLITFAVTDASGKYAFTIHEAGVYTVLARGSSYEVRENLNVSGGVDLNQTDFVRGSQTFAGTVTDDATGQPIEGAYVSLAHPVLNDHGLHLPAGTTDSDGDFELAGLAPGQYEVLVTIPGKAAQFKTITVPPTGSPPPLSAALKPEARIVGRVKNGSDDSAATNATVTVFRSSDHKLIGTTMTDDQGDYIFDQLTEGESYFVLIRQGDQANALFNTVTPTTNSTLLNATLSDSVSEVRGSVVADGRPLAGAQVLAYDSEGRLIATVRTEADGSYAIKTLTPGSITLKALSDGFKAATGSTMIALGLHNLPTMSASPLATMSANPNPPPPPPPVEEVDLGANPNVIQPPLAPPPPPLTSEGCESKHAALVRAHFESRALFDRLYAAKSADNTWENIIDVGSILLQAGLTAKSLYDLLPHVRAANLATDTAIQLAFSAPLSGDLALSFGYAAAAKRKLLGDMFTNLAANMYGVFSGMKAAITGLTTRNKSYSAATFLADLSSITGGVVASVDLIRVFSKDARFASVLMTNPALKYAIDTIAALDNVVQLANQMGDTIKKVALRRGNIEDLQYEYAVNRRIEDQLLAIFLACNERKVPPKPPGGPRGSTTNTGLGEGHPTMRARAPGRYVSDTAVVGVWVSRDPNDKNGPAGFGPEGYIRDGALPYEVLFENDPDAGATAAAQVVIISDTLDADLDLSSVEFTGFGFGDFNFDVPAGLNRYETTLDLRPQGINLLVPVTLEVNTTTRELTARFESLDPITRIAPDGVDDGFLPVNDKNIGNGEGYIRFLVRPLAGKPSGTAIRNKASIIFDTNDPIITREVLNTLDVAAPTSAVTALPTDFVSALIPVSWAGQDDVGGSGIQQYDVYYSENNGPFVPFALETTSTSTLFRGNAGSTYRFYSIATDGVGQRQASSPTVTTTLTAKQGAKQTFTDEDGDLYTMILSGPGQMLFLPDDPDGNSRGPIGQIMLSGTDPAKSAVTVSVKKSKTGDGFVNVAQIVGTGLKRLTMSKSNIAGPGIQLTGPLGSLTARDLHANTTLEAGGSAANKTTLKIHQVFDDVTIDLGSSISSFAAAAIGDGSIKAASLGSLVVRGDAKNKVNNVLTPIRGDVHAKLTLTGTGDAKRPITLGAVKATGNLDAATWDITGDIGTIQIGGTLTDWDVTTTGSIKALTLGTVAHADVTTPKSIGTLKAKAWSAGHVQASSLGTLAITTGNWGADLSLTGANVLANRPTLGTATIKGSTTGSTIHVNGTVKSFTTGALENSDLWVGYTPTLGSDPWGGGAFNTGANLLSFRVLGNFANSIVAAHRFGTVRLNTIQGANTGAPFGLIADMGIDRLLLTTPKLDLRSVLTTPSLPGTLGDFTVHVL